MDLMRRFATGSETPSFPDYGCSIVGQKYELLFEAYSRWGAGEGAEQDADQPRRLSSLQLTKWLRNVGILDGSKVCLK